MSRKNLTLLWLSLSALHLNDAYARNTIDLARKTIQHPVDSKDLTHLKNPKPASPAILKKQPAAASPAPSPVGKKGEKDLANATQKQPDSKNPSNVQSDVKSDAKGVKSAVKSDAASKKDAFSPATWALGSAAIAGTIATTYHLFGSSGGAVPGQDVNAQRNDLNRKQGEQRAVDTPYPNRDHNSQHVDLPQQFTDPNGVPVPVPGLVDNSQEINPLGGAPEDGSVSHSNLSKILSELSDYAANNSHVIAGGAFLGVAGFYMLYRCCTKIKAEIEKQFHESQLLNADSHQQVNQDADKLNESHQMKIKELMICFQEAENIVRTTVKSDSLTTEQITKAYNEFQAAIMNVTTKLQALEKISPNSCTNELHEIEGAKLLSDLNKRYLIHCIESSNYTDAFKQSAQGPSQVLLGTQKTNAKELKEQLVVQAEPFPPQDESINPLPSESQSLSLSGSDPGSESHPFQLTFDFNNQRGQDNLIQGMIFWKECPVDHCSDSEDGLLNQMRSEIKFSKNEETIDLLSGGITTGAGATRLKMEEDKISSQTGEEMEGNLKILTNEDPRNSDRYLGIETIQQAEQRVKRLESSFEQAALALLDKRKQLGLKQFTSKGLDLESHLQLKKLGSDKRKAKEVLRKSKQKLRKQMKFCQINK